VRACVIYAYGGLALVFVYVYDMMQIQPLLIRQPPVPVSCTEDRI